MVGHSKGRLIMKDAFLLDSTLQIFQATKEVDPPNHRSSERRPSIDMLFSVSNAYSNMEQ